MTQQLTGFLPKNSTDNRVIFNIDLTDSDVSTQLDALVTSGELDSWSILGTGSTLDGNGFNAGTGTGGFRIVLSDANADKLDYHAEFLINVESRGVTINDPTTMFSYGANDFAGEMRLLDAFTTVGYAGAFQVLKVFNTILAGWSGINSPYTEFVDRIKSTYGTAYAIYAHSDMHSENLDINIVARPKTWEVGLDNTVWVQGDRNTVSKQFKVLVFGSDRGTGKSFPFNIRHIQIAARDVAIPCIAPLRHVQVLSDSMFDAGNMTTAFREGNAAMSFRQEVENRGFRCGTLAVDENAGFTVAQLSTRITAILEKKPSVVLYRGLTNNLTPTEGPGIIDGTVETQLKADIEKILGKNGNPATSVEHFVIGTPPKRLDNANIQVYVDAAVTLCFTLKEWVDTTYGEGLMSVADVHKDVGGNSITSGADPLSDTLRDGVHMYPRGNIAMGRSYARATLNNLVS